MLVFGILTRATAKPKDEVAQLQPEKTPETREVIETDPLEVTEPVKETPELTPEPVAETETNRNEILKILKVEASAEWGNDYQMVQYEYENQIEAYDWVVKQDEYPDIMSSAKSEWGNDYTMVEYEYKKQVKAYESL